MQNGRTNASNTKNSAGKKSSEKKINLILVAQNILLTCEMQTSRLVHVLLEHCCQTMWPVNVTAV